MTLCSKLLDTSRLWAAVLAIVYTSLTFSAAIAPSEAQAAAPAYYTATLDQPAPKARVVAGGVAWSCEGTRCVGARGTSRPLRMCRELFRKTGPLAAFVANGRPLSEDQLAKCNR